jgi:antitoxin component of RelBE/YafQ-DinJ toxin-antitoxin module
MDLSSAVKIYLKQSILCKGIPFLIKTANGLSPEQEKEILLASSQAKKGKNTTNVMSAKEAINYLKKL